MNSSIHSRSMCEVARVPEKKRPMEVVLAPPEPAPSDGIFDSVWYFHDIIVFTSEICGRKYQSLPKQ